MGLKEYRVKFALLACITSAALDKHHQYMSRIGSRFLFYRIPALSADERQAGYQMVFEPRGRRQRIEELRRAVEEHLTALLKMKLPEPESSKVREQLKLLAELLRRARADIRYGKPEDSSTYEIIDVQIEEPWRAAQQLRNLGRALAVVHGRSQITDHEIELLRRVVLSSFPASRLKVLRLFVGTDNLSREQVKEGLGQSYGRGVQLLNELVRTELLVEHRTGDAYSYTLPTEFADTLRQPFTPLDHIGDLVGDGLTQDSPLTSIPQEKDSRNASASGGAESCGTTPPTMVDAPRVDEVGAAGEAVEETADV